MENTKFAGFGPRATAINQNPTPIARGKSTIPVRVLVRNVGPVVVFFSDTTQSLVGTAVGNTTYQLAPGDADVFILAPAQNLMAVAAGPGGRVVVSQSEALPLL